ncbi:hypothetical protein HYW17_02435 [Candidatus Uhrbacteria bacterium]|nr:hypothetical protein [Candidatus Uhrbacteria bacterium]
MAKLFGTSGARGKTNLEITPMLAFCIALCYGLNLKSAKGGKRVRVLVGHDQRFGADMLANSVIAGFQAVGVDVVMLGMVPTGVYCVYMREGNFDGGILVTGSHMRPERIGIIPMLGNGHYADRDVTDPIEIRLATIDVLLEEEHTRGRYLVGHEHIGGMTSENGLPRYADSVCRAFGRDWIAIKGAGFRVILDPGNGTAGEISQHLLGVLRLTHTVLNSDPKPIPDRRSECTPENCAEAIARTRDGGFTLGACFDGDADRVKFITPEGVMLQDDVVAGIFARHLLQADDVVVTPVNASGMIEEICRERVALVKYCRIGQPATDTAVRTHKAVFAFEANAGKYGFREFECCYDGVYAALKMLAIMAKTGKSLAELAADLPRCYQAAVRIEVPDARKEAVVAVATESLRASLVEEIVWTDTTDGTKWFMKSGAWLLLRPSGTEPVVRAYSDARTQERADELVRMAREEFERALTA